MKNTIYQFIFLLFLGLNSQAQEFFNIQRQPQTQDQFTRSINNISYDIDLIVKKNKNKLKEELNTIEEQLLNNEINKPKADSLRNERAEFYAGKIEEQIQAEEEKIRELINNKIEDNINFSTDMSSYQKKLIEKRTLFLMEINFGNSMMLVDNKIKNDYYSSVFFSNFGLGIGAKTRLGSEKSKFFMRYDLGYTMSSFKPKGNKILAENGDEMILEESPVPLKKSTIGITEFKLSNYFEYDFSKKRYDDFGNEIIKSRQSVFVGLGGYIGINAQTNRNLKYEENGKKYQENTISKFNTEKFIYGVGAYVGIHNISVRATYNLNQVFKKSFADHTIFNVSVVLELM